jgi:hypothetical protein
MPSGATENVLRYCQDVGDVTTSAEEVETTSKNCAV